MATINHISLISVPVSDQQRAKAFYVDKLGFEVIADQPFGGDGNRWIQLGPPGAKTSITLTNWFDDFTPGSLRGLLIDVDDVESSRADLMAAGIEFAAETAQTPWGKFAAFEDPDGNRWNLHELAPEMKG